MRLTVVAAWLCPRLERPDCARTAFRASEGRLRRFGACCFCPYTAPGVFSHTFHMARCHLPPRRI